MSLQTDLQTAIAKVTADGNLLHDIVHGDAASTVVTESGPVKTVAKARPSPMWWRRSVTSTAPAPPP